MDSDRLQEQAVEVLQEFGLKEYEAKSFVALSRMPQATAKEISETTDVPRTRVYDAVRSSPRTGAPLTHERIGGCHGFEREHGRNDSR